MATIEDLINNVSNQDFSAAGPTFNELMQAKITDALEQQKIAVAGQIFNGDEEDDIEDDFTDEEINDAIEELDDEDEDEEDLDEE